MKAFEAMPGWKRDVGRRLDALIVRTVPGVREAVKWNSPFYGVEDQGWFLGIHCFTKYIWPEIFTLVARRVADILNGAKPADLPVEQPTKHYVMVT